MRLAGQTYQFGVAKAGVVVIFRRHLHRIGIAAPQTRNRPCGSCTKCLNACPTDAFPAPYQLEARRCISYLTIEHKGPIPTDLRPAMGNRIYGCDDCLAACPWNKFAQASAEAAFHPREDLVAPKLAELATFDDAGFRQYFKGSPIKRIGRDRFTRNVLIALGNSGDSGNSGNSANPQSLTAIEPLLDDPSPLVRGAAIWATAQLATPEAFDLIRQHRQAQEADAPGASAVQV